MRRRNFLRRVLGIVGCSAFVTPFVDAKYPENDIQHCCSSYDVPHGIHVSREQLHEMIRMHYQYTDISVSDALYLATKAYYIIPLPCNKQECFSISKLHIDNNRWDLIKKVNIRDVINRVISQELEMAC